ncbi:hypothetical protein BDV41DRAFT_591376 [Aspergillus transmontanensis]|uniref:Uncharacterized protein n=1 Tax=Aspergillus transmontanensis TaxID=1034304 RepID=A0A5N6WDH7_9EURO|nr:hypothetical protein BDV41DRAFT_591376 [Aspergillus transmontanensis]
MFLAIKQHKPLSPTACLTYDALENHNQNTLPLPSCTLLNIALEERVGSLSAIPVMLPPSTHSSKRSRTSSPTRLSDTQYRGGHLRRAKICHYTDTSIFHNLTDYDLHQVSERLWREAEWTEALYAAINDLKPAEFEAVHWRGDLKPPVQNPRPTIPRKRSQLLQLLQGNATADGLYQSTDSPRAIEPTIPVVKLKDPRPDICVGLSDDSLADALRSTKDRYIAQSLLLDMQDTSTLISDPHVTPLGLRFSFFDSRGKGRCNRREPLPSPEPSCSGLSGLRDGQDPIEKNHDNVEASNESGQASPNIELNMVFSITTEGPVHELWIHFRERTWRTTLKDGSLNFLRHLSAILRWGNGEFKDQIISVLKDL